MHIVKTTNHYEGKLNVGADYLIDRAQTATKKIKRLVLHNY